MLITSIPCAIFFSTTHFFQQKNVDNFLLKKRIVGTTGTLDKTLIIRVHQTLQSWSKSRQLGAKVRLELRE